MTVPPAYRYAQLVAGGVGNSLAARLGLPRPVALRRWDPAGPLLPGGALVTGLNNAQLAPIVSQRFDDRGVLLLGVEGSPRSSDTGSSDTGSSQGIGAIVLDASAAMHPDDLADIRATLAPQLNRLERSGRVVLLGTDPATLGDPVARATQQAIVGLLRSLAKELRHGATANLVLAADSPAQVGQGVATTVEFLASGRAAYVNGQTIAVRRPPMAVPEPVGWQSLAQGFDHRAPLRGKVALVTGAARGIGAVVAQVLARDGARVTVSDVPGSGQALAEVANHISGTALQLDVTAPDSGRRMAEHARRAGGFDLLVHNAGITRDRMLVNMSDEEWRRVIEVDLAAQLRIDDVMLAQDGAAAPGARVVSVSSLSGIAGNRGQTNYAAAKAGIIGMVAARAEALAERGITYNAVAPGFIETEMTQRMPVVARELGRRLNSLGQGGLPVDVAEVIGFFAHPQSAGINGQIVRVCGQSVLGA